MFTALLVSFLPLISCSFFEKEAHYSYWEQLAKDRLQDLTVSPSPHARPKNVIIFLGDGMGLTAVSTARMYKSEKIQRPYSEMPFFFEQFRTSGLVKTSSLNKHVTDSAASAMALFTGLKVEQYTLGIQPNFPVDCSKGKSGDVNNGIAELALRKNLSVGFVTTHRITSATPAALFAKGVERWIECDAEVEKLNRPLCADRDIAKQLLEYPARDFKVMMGGGRNRLEPSPGMRKDGRNITEEWRQLPGKRQVLNNVDELDNLIVDKYTKVLGLFADNSFPFHLDETVSKVKTVPRLKEMTEKAIELLEKGNNQGYLLLVEGGIIDTAEHYNQMRLASEEVLEFDEAVKMAREMTNPDETLILVTADHSHAVSLPGSLDKTSSVFGSAKVWSQREEDTSKVPGIFFVTGPGADRPLNFNEEEGADPHFVSPAAIFAVQGSHGGEDVGIWADGPSSRLFSGTFDNTAVAHTVRHLLCLYDDSSNCVKEALVKDSEPQCEALFPALVIAIVAVLVALFSIAALLLLLWKNKPNKVAHTTGF